MIRPRAVPLLAALATLACTASPAAAAPGDAPFTAASELSFEAGSQPTAVAVGDFNSDNKQDLALADRSGARVSVRLGNGNGTFSTAGTIGGLDRPTALVAGDFNGDGNEDLAAAAGTAPNGAISLLVGTGTGEFVNASAIPLPGGFARSLATGEFNGDGRTDLVAAADQHVSVRYGAGDGELDGGGVDVPFVGTSSSPPQAPQSVATGDFDGNGIQDVAVSVIRPSTRTESLFVLPGLGNGGFADKNYVTMPGPALSVAVGDVNADSKQDVVGAVFERDSVAVRLGDGTGRVVLVPDLADVAVGDRPASIALGDFDGDGDEDFVVANSDADTVSVRLGDGAGRFTDGGEVAVGDGPAALAVADFDADGRADFAVANRSAGTVSVRLGAGEAPLAGNLLVNGGFEQGIGIRLPTQASRPPGWSITGGMTAMRYGANPVSGFPGRIDGPRYQAGGANFLWGGTSGPDGITTATQAVDLSGSATAIDRGLATVRLSAWLGGAQRYPDFMTATANFVDASGASTGLLRLEPGDRRGVTTLLRRAGDAKVPAGTRRVEVVLTSVDTDNVSSAMADNVKLTLDAPVIPPEPGGRPSGGPNGGGGADRPGGRPGADRDAPVISRVRIKTGRGRAKVRYTLSEPAAVTVRIERVAKKRRRVAVGTLRRAGKAGGNRVALRRRIGRKALRPGAYRLVLTALDAAGNRSVAKPRRFRIAR